MNTKPNPYAPPSPIGLFDFASKAIRRFRGRSFIAVFLAIVIGLTSALLTGLSQMGLIELGNYGALFLGSLVIASLALFLSGYFYARGARGTAVGLAVAAPVLMFSTIALALHDAGILTF